MNHFPFLFLREFLMSFLPSLLFARARDDSYANSEMSSGVDRRGCGVLCGFSVKNWYCPEESRGVGSFSAVKSFLNPPATKFRCIRRPNKTLSEHTNLATV